MDILQIREQVPLGGLLARLGRKASPTFSINETLGVWYDHSTHQGGDVIDFGVRQWPELSREAVCHKLLAAMQTEPAQPRTHQRRRRQKWPYLRIEKTAELGTTESITFYLQKLGLWETAQRQLSEVHYFLTDEKGLRKSFCAPGHRNESGGWEIRNKYFKGCIGAKGLTHYAGDQRKLSVFQHYFDYLAWNFEYPEAADSIIVLNNPALLQSATRVALRYSDITLYFNHDAAGGLATRKFIAALPYATDGSGAYAQKYNYSEKRRIEARNQRQVEKPKDFMAGLRVPFER